MSLICHVAPFIAYSIVNILTFHVYDSDSDSDSSKYNVFFNENIPRFRCGKDNTVRGKSSYADPSQYLWIQIDEKFDP